MNQVMKTEENNDYFSASNEDDVDDNFPSMKRRKKVQGYPCNSDWASARKFHPIMFDVDNTTSGISNHLKLPVEATEMDVFISVYSKRTKRHQQKRTNS